MIGLLASALAKPPAPDPVAVAAAESAACAPDVPEGFQIHTGYATDLDPARAVDLAVTSARQTAIAAVCAGKTEARCALVRRHLEAWKTPYWNPLTHRACAHVGVARDWLDDDREDTAAFLREVARLAVRVAEGAKGRPIVLRPVSWSRSGCSAGPAGAVLEAELRNALGGVGNVVLADGASKGAVAVRMGLDPRGGEVVLTASLDDAAAGGSIPLPGFSFPGDVLSVEAPEEDCRFDAVLGLVDGRRAGADGRRVELLAGDVGAFCAGETFHPRVVVSRPSTVRVFSVDRAGTAILVWPPKGHDGRVERELDLGEFAALPTPAGGDEKLLAVAIEPGKPIGRTATWGGICQVPGAFDATWYAAEAAAGAATFEVRDPRADECAGRAAVGAPAMPPIPVCPAVLGGG